MEAIEIGLFQEGGSTKCYLRKAISVTLSSGELVTIPVGFVSDGVSSPRWAWPVFPQFGRHLRAALVHDYLLHLNYSRKEAAKEMLVVLIEDNIPAHEQWLMYSAVRANDRVKKLQQLKITKY